MPVATASRKRKQPEDAEVSPPKRVTRSRAAAKAGDLAPAAATKSATSIKSSRPATRNEGKTSVTSTTAPARRRVATKLESQDSQPTNHGTKQKENGEEVEETEAAEVPRTRGRPRKVVQQKSEEKAEPQVTRSKGRPTKTVAKPSAQRPTRTVKTRTGTTSARTVSLDEAVSEDDEDDELMAPDVAATKTPEAVTRKTGRSRTGRGPASIKVTAPSTRVAAAASQARSTRATGPTASTAARNASAPDGRRVAFRDEPFDKENRPVSRSGEVNDAKPSLVMRSASGVRGKPVRGNGAAGSVRPPQSSSEAPVHTRAGSKTKQPSDEDRPKTPLSPKKISQVAKGNGNSDSPATVDYASSSEDELSGATAASRSPAVRPLQKSPVKPPPAPRRELPSAELGLSTLNQTPQMPASGRPGSRDGLSLARGADILLGRTPIRPPPSSSKSAQTSRPEGTGPRPGSQEGEQTGSLNVSLLRSPAKRPPTRGTPGNDLLRSVPALKSSDKIDGDFANAEGRAQAPEDSAKKNLLQSPARRPKFSGAMTAVPKEKKVIFHFGDETKHGNNVGAFRFAAATPRRIRALKPSQRLMDDIVENEDSPDAAASGKSPMVANDGETDGDVSMLDVQNDTIIYTPSKKRTTLFDSPLVTRSRPVSPQKQYLAGPSETPSSRPAGSDDASKTSDEQISRTLFRDTRPEDQLSSADTTLDMSFSVRTPNLSPARTFDSNHRRSLRGKKSLSKKRETFHMTPLAHQFGAWLAASPEKKAGGGVENARQQDKSPRVSSVGLPEEGIETGALEGGDVEVPEMSQFEEEMASRDATQMTDTDLDLDLDTMDLGDDDMVVHDLDFDATRLGLNDRNSLTPDANKPCDYADENDASVRPVTRSLSPVTASIEPPVGAPAESRMYHVASASKATVVDPLAMHATPEKSVRPPPREVLTVSKVPLKPADSAFTASPVKSFRRKVKSLAPETVLGEIDANAVIESIEEGPGTTEETSPRDDGVQQQQENDTVFSISTPLRTPRRGADARMLRGAVVFVDVHTTEGADASGLFVELLIQMGARCVKSWTWNPRSSSTNGETPGGSKVGITHVVFKDGGKRTLEKVREARGLVSCVGVGWVLDCERHNRWLDESEYSIDTSIVPRGGHNRRKSMEPRALANVNGALRSAPLSPGRELHRRSVSTPTTSISPTKEFLTFSPTPNAKASNRDYAELAATPTISGPMFSAPTPTINFGSTVDEVSSTPETPLNARSSDWLLDTPGGVGNVQDEAEPVTPFFVTEEAKLVQATCPPKQQTGRRLFPLGGRVEDEADEELRRRLEIARRKSLQWAPRVGSPLRRDRLQELE